MSQPNERTQKVFNAIKKAVDNSASTPVRSGDISQILRDGGFPLGSWEIRAEFSALQSLKLLELNPAQATWSLTGEGAATDKITELA